MTLASGSVLVNRYRIERLLGSGGMGAVYRAYDTELHRTIAIKENIVAVPGLASDVIEARRRQFEREAAMLSSLHHPNIPGVLDHFSTPEGNQYLVMDFIEGDDMAQIIAHKGRLPEAEAIVWVGQVCDALEYLHSQNPPVVHRDVKPQNIKVTSKGQVFLVDFGIAKLGGVDSKTTRGALSVTQGFSPPEQYAMTGTDARSDIYSLGATLYALLTGQVPPDSISLQGGEVQLVPPREMNEAISPGVQQAVLLAMETRRSDRPQTVREFWQMLTAGSGALDVKTVLLTAQGQGSLAKAIGWGRGNLRLVLLGAAGIVVLAVALGLSLSKLPTQLAGNATLPMVGTPASPTVPPTESPIPTTPTLETPATNVDVALGPTEVTPSITVLPPTPTETLDASEIATQQAEDAMATRQTANLVCNKVDFQVLGSPGTVQTVADVATNVQLSWRVGNRASSPSCEWGQTGQELQILRAVLVGAPSTSGTPVKLTWIQGDEYNVSFKVQLGPGYYALGWKLLLPNMDASDSPTLEARVNVIELTPRPFVPIPTPTQTPCPVITYPCHCHQECVGRNCTTVCDELCTRVDCGKTP